MHDARKIPALLFLACVLAGGCQPASDVPYTDTPAEGSEPPPPPPLPTETAAAGDPVPIDTVVPPPPAADTIGAGDTVAVPPAAQPPAQDPPPAQPPAAQPAPADCAAPAVTAAAAQRVRVFFSCGEEIAPVERAVASTRAVLRTSLDELLRGPTAEERAAGFTSFFGPATAGALNSVVVRDGVAHIDFADFSRAIPNASSSFGSTQLLGQLRATIFQYPSIRSARITFDGSCDAFWDWLQRGCMPLNR